MDVSPVPIGADASPPSPSPSPDWWSVPSPLLASIFRRVLENYDTAEAIAQNWTNLATVCQAWLHAARLTPLCLHLAEPKHLTDPRMRSWLSKSTLEVLVINRNAAMAHQNEIAAAGAAAMALFDKDLLSRPETAQSSENNFSALINASLGAAPLLRPFTSLQQLSLFTPVLPAPAAPETVDIAALAALTQLSCLTLAGHMAVPDFSPLPASLKHLSLSLHVRDHADGFFFSGKAQTVALPPNLTNLEFLAIKASYLVVSWEDLLNHARQIHLSANYLGLTSSRGVLHDPGSFAMSLVNASSNAAECAVLAFHRLGLFPPEAPPPQDLRPAAGDVDLDFFLEVVRERAMATWDMDPVMDAPPSFVNDLIPLDECFCLTLERQEAGEPRSYHFTTPLSDAEVALLRQQPAWRLVWCRDPRTAEVLADPQFVAANAPHLVRLSRCALPEGVDLRAFTALRSLHCELAGAVPSVRFPSGLTSLELEVPQPEMPMPEGFDIVEMLEMPPMERRKFSARTLAPLKALRDLALTGWHRVDLADLAPSVTSVRLLNPLTDLPEEGITEVLGEKLLRFPRALMPAKSAAAFDAQRELRAIKRGQYSAKHTMDQHFALLDTAGGAPVWSDDEADDLEAADAAAAASEQMEIDAGGSQAPPPDVQQPGDQQDDVKKKKRRRRRMPHHDNDLDEHAHLVYALTGHDDDLYDTSPGDDDSDPAAAAGNGGHGRAGCKDPNCPIHSGKPHLQLTFSDSRTEIPIDLSYIVASGFPMVSLTLDPVPEAAQAGVYMVLEVGQSWDSFVEALKNSKIEVLEINHHQNGVAWVPDARAWPGKQHFYLWEGLQALQKDLGDVFDFKTWDGVVSRSGLVKEGLCYALVRKQRKDGKKKEGSGSGSGADEEKVK